MSEIASEYNFKDDFMDLWEIRPSGYNYRT